MDAYWVPLVASILAAVAVAASLGAVRIGRWWQTMMRARAGFWVPRPGIPPDTVDLQLPQLAYRTLGAALLVGATGLLLLADAGTGPLPAGDAIVPLSAALALAVVWWTARPPR
jgi:hypothetical protein